MHTGKLLSFVYDIADLYKTETSIPAAFEAVKEKPEDLERRVRILIWKKSVQANLMKRIADDITWIFDIPLHEEQDNQMNVGNLWDDTGEITGGKNHAGDSGWL